jgi:hypothetical protein
MVTNTYFARCTMIEKCRITLRSDGRLSIPRLCTEALGGVQELDILFNNVL